LGKIKGVQANVKPFNSCDVAGYLAEIAAGGESAGEDARWSTG